MALDASQDQIAERLAKLASLREKGIDPYPHSFDAQKSTTELKEAHDALSGEELDATPSISKVGGRVVALRGMGKAGFLDITDGLTRLQLYVRRDDLPDEDVAAWKATDLGDWVGVEGRMMRTRSGELSIQASSYTMLSKALRPLPIGKTEEVDGETITRHGFSDKELRYRQRYVDLAVNAEVRTVFETRSRIISSMRRFLEGRGFLEVETPILQTLHGGASARPFETQLNALSGMPIFLRIAEELHLKRLTCGGFERVYEIGRTFRNEGIDRTHNPEFTMLELYQAYADYDTMAELMETMVSQIAQEVLGTTKIVHDGQEIELAPPWRRITMLDALRELGGVTQDLSELPREELLTACKEHGVDISPKENEGKLLDALFSDLVQPKLIQPTFVLDYPLAISPLAKMHRSKPMLTERFEPFVAGWELGNAFSELNDPIDQRERFEAQMRLRAAGDDEAQPIDEDFLMALEHGMPPTGGLGVGIDRLVMLLTDRQSIRDVLFFPFMRPLDSTDDNSDS